MDDNYADWLTEYVPWDNLEREYLAIHRLCWDRQIIGADKPDRHLTASAFVAHPDGTRILTLWHEKADRWLQPGGHLDPGESPVDACLRELAEETGLVFGRPSCIFDLDVHRIGPSTKMPAHDHVDARFFFQASSVELPVSPEGSALRWISWEEFAGGDPVDSGLQRVSRKVKANRDRAQPQSSLGADKVRLP